VKIQKQGSPAISMVKKRLILKAGLMVNFPGQRKRIWGNEVLAYNPNHKHFSNLASTNEQV
jgi:hypothetical protein